MDFPQQYTIYVILAPLVMVISISFLVYVRSHYAIAETKFLAWLILIISGWLFFNTLEVIDPREAGTVFWSKLSYGFIAFTSVAWMAFALQYSNHPQWLAPSKFFLFCLIPTATTLIAWTNDWHHLLWTAYHFTPVGGMLALNVSYGPWFWVHVIASYTMIFGGAVLIIRHYFKSFSLYRRQSTWVVIGALIPIMVNMAYIFRLFPILKKDYTAVSFALGGMCLAVGIFRYHLFNLKPIARDVVIENIKEAMLTLDIQGRIIDLNPAAQAIINVPINEAIGRLATDVFNLTGDITPYLRAQTDTYGELTLGDEPSTRQYDLLVSPLFNTKGHLNGRLMILHEITLLKQAEATLRQYANDLEVRNEELDAFAYTVAHDLKNLLTAQMGYGELLQNRFQTIPSQDITRYLNTMVRSSQKMITIVNELLLLARVRKLTDIEVNELDTGDIVDEVLMRLNRQIEQHDAQIVLPDTWPRAVGYGPWVEEVWMNYISNAVKYGGERPCIELGADEFITTSDRKSMIRFWIRDTGTGIPADKQLQLFTLFSRLTPTRVDGHGLGLSIVQRIVTKLGGEVGVESQEGKGSLFWFTLPPASTLET